MLSIIRAVFKGEASESGKRRGRAGVRYAVDEGKGSGR